jgi:hypothetical protein
VLWRRGWVSWACLKVGRLTFSMSSSKRRRRSPSFLVQDDAAVFSRFLPIWEFMQMTLVFQFGSAARRPSLSAMSCVYIMLITSLDIQLISHHFIVYYLLKHLESFISVLSTAFQHAIVTFFAGVGPDFSNFGSLGCPS